MYELQRFVRERKETLNVCVCERAERNGAGEVCPQNNLSDFEVNC